MFNLWDAAIEEFELCTQGCYLQEHWRQSLLFVP